MPVHKISELKSKELFPGFVARTSCMERMMFSHWTVKQGAILPEHHHTHEQISILIKGQFEFTIHGEKHMITPGMVIMIPSEAKHSGYAVTDCMIIDIFSPVREDYQTLMSSTDS